MTLCCLAIRHSPQNCVRTFRTMKNLTVYFLSCHQKNDISTLSNLLHEEHSTAVEQIKMRLLDTKWMQDKRTFSVEDALDMLTRTEILKVFCPNCNKG